MADGVDGGSILVYEIPITETQSNQAVFCSGVAMARKSEDLLHVVFFIDQPTVGGGAERSANLRVIMSATAWSQGMDVVSRAVGGRGSDTDSEGEG